MSLVYTVPADPATPRGDARRNSVYIGGRHEAKNLCKLNQWGVTRILNVTPAKETSIQAGVPNFFEKSQQGQMVYKRISVYDGVTSASELERQSEAIVSFISNGLFHGSVLVHCQHGVSRSTTCVVMYLMRKVGMSLDDAMKTVQRRRPHAQPIPAFFQVLERYELLCQQQQQQDGVDGDDNDHRSSRRPAKKQKTIMGPPAAPLPSIGPSRPSNSMGPARGPPSDTDGDSKKESAERIVPSIIGPSIRPPSGSPSGPLQA